MKRYRLSDVVEAVQIHERRRLSYGEDLALQVLAEWLIDLGDPDGFEVVMDLHWYALAVLGDIRDGAEDNVHDAIVAKAKRYKVPRVA